jgi:hypothetical protein
MSIVQYVFLYLKLTQIDSALYLNIGVQHFAAKHSMMRHSYGRMQHKAYQAYCKKEMCYKSETVQ